MKVFDWKCDFKQNFYSGGSEAYLRETLYILNIKIPSMNSQNDVLEPLFGTRQVACICVGLPVQILCHRLWDHVLGLFGVFWGLGSGMSLVLLL